MNPMRTIRTLLLLPILLLLPAAALALVQGADFDNLPTGPYTGTAVIGGDVTLVSVQPVGAVGASAPPGAVGNVLVIDNSGGGAPITVTFTYDCDDLPEEICEIEYDFYYEAWLIGAWIAVYVDADGVYENPDDLFEPPVGFPPSTSWGDNTEREYDCAGTHTITFVVGPGAVAYLDNFETECLDMVPNETPSWGALKSLYR